MRLDRGGWTKVGREALRKGGVELVLSSGTVVWEVSCCRELPDLGAQFDRGAQFFGFLGP